jgi:SAM-dependent methyltransferase
MSESASVHTSDRSPIAVEALDSPALDAATTRATLRDIALANAWFGGRAAVVHGVRRLLGGMPLRRALRVLDVGAGLGDVLRDLRGRLRKDGVSVEPIALDWHREAARLCAANAVPSAVGDARFLPFADCDVDIVVASQLLHHFRREAAVRVVRELDRVAQLGVVVADLRRARRAAVGIWAAAHALRFHPVSRRDGVVSVRRGYSVGELTALLNEAGVAAVVHRRPGFRLVATWRSCARR